MARGRGIGRGMPAHLTIVAIFLFLAAAVATVTGFSVLFPNPLFDLMWKLIGPRGWHFRNWAVLLEFLC